MSTTRITASRGADLSRTYTWPDTEDLTADTGVFNVYDELGGNILLSVSPTPNANGSQITFDANTATLLVKAADIATLAVAAPTTDPAIYYYDFFITSGSLTTKFQGGAFVIPPVGAIPPNAETLEVSLDGDAIEVSVAARGVKGDPGANVMAIGLFTQLGAMTIPTGTDMIQSSGYSVNAIGPARYKRLGAGAYAAKRYRGTDASGQWWELAENDVTLEMFGGQADGVLNGNGTVSGTDNADAFDAAMDYLEAKIVAPRIRGGVGVYAFTRTLKIHRAVTISGLAGAGLGNSVMSTWWAFPSGVTGIMIFSGSTLDPDTGLSDGRNAGGTVLEYLVLESTATVVNLNAHAICMRARALVRGCRIANFSGNGIDIQSLNGANVNNWALEYGQVQGCTHGIYVDGSDVNAGVAIQMSCIANRGWGMFDSSFLGNHWIACHTATNALGPYQTDNANARSVFLGCYSESGQPTSSFQTSTIVIGGLHGSAVTGGVQIINAGIANGFTSITSQSLTGKFATGVTDYDALIGNRSATGINTTYATRVSLYSAFKADGVTARPMAAMLGKMSTSTGNTRVGLQYYNYAGDAWATALWCDGTVNKIWADPGVTGVWSFGDSTSRFLAGYFNNVVLNPPSSVTLSTNGDLSFQATSDTQLTIKFRGSDGTTRRVDLPLNANATFAENTATYDPPSLAVGAADTIQTMTVTGAALGDFVDVSFSLDRQGIELHAWVSAANTVKYQFRNPSSGTAGTIDLASGTVKCRIRK